MDSDCVEYFKYTFACVPSMVFDGGCNEIFTVLENKLKFFRHPKIEDDLRRSLPVLCVTMDGLVPNISKAVEEQSPMIN
jgi:hypothetical protein